MATITCQITAVAADAAEYASIVSKLDAYEADPGNEPLDSRSDDESSLTVIYTITKEQAP